MRLNDAREMGPDELVCLAEKFGFTLQEIIECPLCGAECLRFSALNRADHYTCVNGHRWSQAEWEDPEEVYC